MKNIVICGDSFNIGIGCEDLHSQPYGSLVAKKLGCNVINLAKGSSTNLSIILQVKYAVENIPDIEYLFLAVSSYNRIEWFPENSKDKFFILRNSMVNYHQYPPYGKATYPPMMLPHPMKNDPNYTGELLTENWLGIIDYVDNFIDKGLDVKNIDYFKKFNSESNEKMTLLRDFYLNFFDERIQREYDQGLFVMGHVLLKKHNIKHYILTWDKGFNDFIPEENIVDVNWGDLSVKYPDKYNTLHTSEEGHKIVFEKILSKIENLK